MGKWIAIAVLMVLATPLLVWAALPWPAAYRWTDPAATAVMRYRVEQAEDEGGGLELRQQWVPLAKISPNMVRAVIASEDGRFRAHHGIDWTALGEELHYQGKPPFSLKDRADLLALAGAGRYYLGHRSEVKGRSTITQQLAKNLYFTPERSLARKAAELFVARRIEKFLTKDRILEIYLNTVELGPGVFGVEAAAQEYFDVPAARLTSFQAASLAATLPQPLSSNPKYRPSRMAWRRDLILRRLRGEDSGLSAIPEAPPAIAAPLSDPASEAAPEAAAAPGDPGAEPLDAAGAAEPTEEPAAEPTAEPPPDPAGPPPAADTVGAGA
ncbi:MAG: monofunctional biosynthetic peptidoglycan transglycosylase [Gemmatimonadetes bacterium]|nr:monofunctional biosynthetic peptidoglycan transglycosylase [Gemmatimonadota bacterium]